MDADAAVGLELTTGARAAQAKKTLFGAASFDHYRMPRPQYLGAKYELELADWIARFIPAEARVALDGFGGSQSVAHMMKRTGRAVHTNDFLKFCHCAGEALVENESALLGADDVAFLFSENKSRGDVMMNFRGVFFAEEECAMLDSFRANVDLLPCPRKRAMAVAVMCRSLTRKTTMGHFAHLKALEYAADPERARRNPSLTKSIRELFAPLCEQYNAAVFDNGRANRSHHGDILDLLPELDGIDFAYYDPPYCGSHADYQAFYHLLETFAENWRGKRFVNANRRYYPPRRSGFDKAREAADSFRRLFALSEKIPAWMISYNDRSVPKIGDLVKMASRHKKKVRVEEKIYANSKGGKGSAAGSREYLLICH